MKEKEELALEFCEVRDIFNCVYRLFEGKISISEAVMNWKGNELFRTLTSHLYYLEDLDYMKFLGEAYSFYRSYAFERLLTDGEWENFVKSGENLVKQYQMNRWCMNIVFVLFRYREATDKRVKREYDYPAVA